MFKWDYKKPRLPRKRKKLMCRSRVGREHYLSTIKLAVMEKEPHPVKFWKSWICRPTPLINGMIIPVNVPVEFY